jgi:hypothetical protein
MERTARRVYCCCCCVRVRACARRVCCVRCRFMWCMCVLLSDFLVDLEEAVLECVADNRGENVLWRSLWVDFS